VVVAEGSFDWLTACNGTLAWAESPSVVRTWPASVDHPPIHGVKDSVMVIDDTARLVIAICAPCGTTASSRHSRPSADRDPGRSSRSAFFSSTNATGRAGGG
jgi:hypothetical protein